MKRLLSLISEEKPERIYNWIRGPEIHSDSFISFSNAAVAKSIDLTNEAKFPQVYNQGKIGSCTANAVCGAYCFDLLNGNTDNKQQYDFYPSRMYLYYKTREMEGGDVKADDGSIIGNAISVLASKGVCSENKWPYNIDNVGNKPTDECDVEADKYKSLEQRRINHTLDDMRSCIESKLPFIFGFDVYEGFQNLPKKSGCCKSKPDDAYVLPLPSSGQKKLGGHAVVAVGYDDDKGLFKIRNSWGSNWGDGGYFYMPYDYIKSNMCADFWVVSKVKSL